MLDSLTLEQKVAQLFMVGFTGAEPGEVTRQFLKTGLGGVIFFRDNFDPLPDAVAVAQLLQGIKTELPDDCPAPFLSIDQEGGQVERLPHTLFPSTVTPRAIALSADPDGLARHTYDLMGYHLRQLGFNMNFAPTLDVNLEPANPIIGARAFGDEPGIVWRLGKIAMESYLAHGILPVGKHFPGHGNGTVDSHEDLPTLTFTETELQPFRQAVETGIPAMMVAHGRYPSLQPASEATLPSSASPTIIQGLLREKLGFDGVVMTDDLCMGAITEHRDATEAALLALKAGVDVLLYRQSTEVEWGVYEAVLAAFREERDGLTRARLEASVSRILAAKARMNVSKPNEEEIYQTFHPDELVALSAEIAHQAITVLDGEENVLPLKHNWPILMVYPDRTKIGNYAFDLPTSPELPTLLQMAGFQRVRSFAYQYKGELPLFQLPDEIETVVFIAFNALLDPIQQMLFQTLKEHYPDARVILVSADAPYDAQILKGYDLHLGLCSYRPPSMQALVERLAGQ